jgi:hypothetical protein
MGCQRPLQHELDHKIINASRGFYLTIKKNVCSRRAIKMRRQFTDDVYKPTSYMTLEQFYKSLQRDTGVDDSFFMFDYPVPENEDEYQQAVKLVKYIISSSHNKSKSSNEELADLQEAIKHPKRK